MTATTSTSSVAYLQAGPTASRPTYRLIQMLRAAAALMVVMHHGSIVLYDRLTVLSREPVWGNGASGVDIFFVISGFVMMISSAPLRNTSTPARIFLMRRIERVVPMYWLLTMLKLILIRSDPSTSLNGTGGLVHVLTSFAFLPHSGSAGSIDPLLVVGWTLNFEMAFYVLFAVSLALRTHVLKVVLPAFLFLVVLSRLWVHGPSMLHVYGDPLVFEFLYGILLAMAVHRIKRIPWQIALALGVVGALRLLVCAPPDLFTWRFLAWGLPAAALVLCAIALEPLLGASSPRWFLELGDASYSIYLTHGFVLPAISILLLREGTAWPGVRIVALLGMLLLSAVVGEIVYRLVERPINNWFKGRRRTAIPANA